MNGKEIQYWKLEELLNVQSGLSSSIQKNAVTSSPPGEVFIARRCCVSISSWKVPALHGGMKSKVFKIFGRNSKDWD